MSWGEADVEAELTGKGWRYSKRPIEHGVQFLLEDGTCVSRYSTGRVVVQGKDTALKHAAQQLFEQRTRSLTGQEARRSAHASTNAPPKVFIVYGHDKRARKELEHLLMTLRLEPVVLEKVPGGGDTLIEKLEKETSVDFACVLLTPDDEGRKKESADRSDQLRPRARQNVVLELGMVLARLGRKRVAILVKGNGGQLERPSDIAGLIYIPFDRHVDEVKDKLASNLMEAGFRIRSEDLARVS